MGRPLWLVSDNFWVCPRASMEAAHARLVTWQSTYVLSFACFKLSRNFKPAVVVDCGVSELALLSACTQAVRCQHCSLDYSGAFPHGVYASSACVVLREHGGAEGGDEPTRRAPQCRARASGPGTIPHRDQHSNTLLHLQNTTDDASTINHHHRLHVPSPSVASQGVHRYHPQQHHRLSA
jgi:hypothetical protein